LVGGSCISLTDFNSDFGKGYIQNQLANQITYYDFINKTDTTKPLVETSDVFNTNFAQAALRCKIESDPKACQVLANLCVLQLYNEQSLACKLFNQIALDREDKNPKPNTFTELGWVPGMPWLYYDQTPK
jgi:hypothetical protein